MFCLALCYFIWPYYDAPSLLLAGKVLLLAFLLAYLRVFPPSRPSLLAGILLVGIAGFTIWAYISSFWSLAPWRTFKHVTEEVLLNFVAFGAGALWVFRASEERLKLLQKLILASFLWVILLYIFFYLWWILHQAPLWPMEDAPRNVRDPLTILFSLPDWHEIILNRQNLATYLLFPCAMSLAYLICARQKENLWKGLFWFLFFLTFLFFTSKRSALLGLFLGGLAAIFIARRWKILLFLTGLSLALLSIVVLTPVKKYFVRENFRLFLEGKKEEWFKGGSIPLRYYGLPFFLDYIRQHPWKGIGFGRFNIKLNPETRALAQKAHLAHAHNIWVNLALHLGLPGLFFFVLFLTGEFACFWKLFKRAGPYTWLGLGFIVYFIAFWVRHQFDDSFRYATSALYFLNTGLGVGLSFKRRET